jgi:hypothetical protein
MAQLRFRRCIGEFPPRGGNWSVDKSESLSLSSSENIQINSRYYITLLFNFGFAYEVSRYLVRVRFGKFSNRMRKYEN